MKYIAITILTLWGFNLCKAENSTQNNETIDSENRNITLEEIENTIWCGPDRNPSGEVQLSSYRFLPEGKAFVMWVWLPPANMGTTNSAVMLGAYAADVEYSITNGYTRLSKNYLDELFYIKDNSLLCANKSAPFTPLIKLQNTPSQKGAIEQENKTNDAKPDNPALTNKTLENTIWCGLQKKEDGEDLLRMFEFFPNGRVSIIWQWLPPADTIEPNGANILAAYAVSASYKIDGGNVKIATQEGEFVFSYENDLLVGEPEKTLEGAYTKIGISRKEGDSRMSADKHTLAPFKRLKIKDSSLSIGE